MFLGSRYTSMGMCSSTQRIYEQLQPAGQLFIIIIDDDDDVGSMDGTQACTFAKQTIF